MGNRFRKREEMKIWIERSIVTSAEELNSRGTRFLDKIFPQRGWEVKLRL